MVCWLNTGHRFGVVAHHGFSSLEAWLVSEFNGSGYLNSFLYRRIVVIRLCDSKVADGFYVFGAASYL